MRSAAWLPQLETKVVAMSAAGHAGWVIAKKRMRPYSSVKRLLRRQALGMCRGKREAPTALSDGYETS